MGFDSMASLQKQFCQGKEKMFPMLMDHTGLKALQRALESIASRARVVKGHEVARNTDQSWSEYCSKQSGPADSTTARLRAQTAAAAQLLPNSPKVLSGLRSPCSVRPAKMLRSTSSSRALKNKRGRHSAADWNGSGCSCGRNSCHSIANGSDQSCGRGLLDDETGYVVLIQHCFVF
jgi:hypothetical protein